MLLGGSQGKTHRPSATVSETVELIADVLLYMLLTPHPGCPLPAHFLIGLFLLLWDGFAPVSKFAWIGAGQVLWSLP